MYTTTRNSKLIARRSIAYLHTCNFALTREVPKSFVNALSKHSKNQEQVNLSVAVNQHGKYVETLRSLVPTLCLPSLETYPDSVFLEDTVVAIGTTAVISNMGHPTRRGEEVTVREILQQLGLRVVDMKQRNPNAFCDGGDVLYTGRHLFVGISERTNLAGFEVLKEVFENINTVAIHLGDKALHLKSVVTNLDERTLLAPSGSLGDSILEQMNVDECGYSLIRLANMNMCNVVSLNGTVFAQDFPCQESKMSLLRASEPRNLKLQFIDTSEFAKCDGALTCCSILLNL